MKVFLLFLPVFLSSFLYAQNVGIGTSAPYSPLTFSNSTGQKISLYGTAVNNYGFGVVGGTLQIHSDAIGSAIAFGYGNSAAFTEIMRMKGNGVKLDITGSNGWDLVNSEGDFRLGNSTYRLKMGVSLSGGGAGTVGLMQYGTAGGNNELSIGSQGKNLIIINGNTDVVELANVPNGKVGIETSAPYSSLTFKNTLGEKISLFGNASNNYGFGIDGSLLQIHSAAVNSDIALGYGSSTAFTETMRIKGNGNVGIGNNPAYLLDVSGRMRIRNSGGPSGTAGIWLNNSANTEKVFVGMEDDTHVGFYSATAGWILSVNTETGTLKVNGKEGAPGQLITSNGTSAASGTSPTSSFYNNTQEFLQISPTTITSLTDVPGLNQTITTPACKVMLILKGQIRMNSCFNCGTFGVKYDIWVDGNLIDRIEHEIGNGETIHVNNGAKIHSLTAGSHTFAVKVGGNSTPREFYVDGFRLVIYVIPQ